MSGAPPRRFSPAPAALRNERDRFVALAFCWADLLFELDEEARITFAAGALDAYLGRGEKELHGRPFLDLVVPADRAIARSLLMRAERRERIDHTLVHLGGPRGETPPLAITGYQLPELGGRYFVALRNCQPAGPALSPVQPGEGCLQKGDAFAASLTRHISAGDAKDTSLSLIVLPGYDELRQRLEEAAELKLVASLGAYLRDHSLGGSMAGRLGTNQFGFMHTPDLDLPRLQQDIAEITRDADPLHQGLGVQAATLAMDVAPLPEEDASRMIAYAVNRLERSGSGDGAGSVVRASISRLAREAVQAADQLQRIVSGDEMEMLLQPIVETETGVTHHYEALARFPVDSPLGDLGQHISFAEFTGLIVDLDLAMARKAIDWLRRETGELSRVSIAVNVSGYSINSMTYLVNLDRMLKDNRWLEGRLLFEITESARIEDLSSANAFVQRLRQQGCKVCLDDFGAGAANFQYLSSLEVDIVKLDGYAFRDALKAKKGKAFLKAFVGLCRELGIATVAEMVENPALYAIARECRVDYVQGYLFGRPSTDVRTFARSPRPERQVRRR
jgi:EAL domain-containing protein (putative c-di-GMP-specific phosphodiesterase class I)